jgi:hypothetical protein
MIRDCRVLGLCISALLLASCGRAPSTSDPPASSAPAPQQQIAGYIFGRPVPLENYHFAKRVAYLFPQYGEERLPEGEREQAIWKALIFHYESFRRNVTVSEAELEDYVNNTVLRSQNQPYTRSGDPAAYARWVEEATGEDVELFENQMRYLRQIEKLKQEVQASIAVAVTEEEMRQEFLNEKRHVGGEMAVFDSRDEAQTFYERAKDPSAWEAVKAGGEPPVRPVGLMTLEAYIDLWSIPKEQIEAFHAMPLGSVGPPMPFGTTQWCVYRLLEKREGNLEEFPKERDSYERQLKAKKQYEGLKRWMEELQASASLKVLPPSS